MRSSHQSGLEYSLEEKDTGEARGGEGAGRFLAPALSEGGFIPRSVDKVV